MEEIVKHINDTNASYRALNAGDAKNTDLFLDNEHYEMFKDAGERITVRFNKENLQKAILFIATILPRKYDNSSTHKKIPFSSAFVLDQLAFLDYFFTIDGKEVETRTQVWNARKDVEKKNGKIDNRFYFNGLLEDVTYLSFDGEFKTAKFTIRNYVAGGYSDLHIKKADDGVFDVWVTNVLEPYYDGKEKGYEQIDVSHQSLQQIFYGAPGTGKSHSIKTEVDEKGKQNFRVTFHPDSDYSTFVGAYKPTMKENIITKNGVETKEEQIVYRFVPQAFTKAYTTAWNTEDDVYLIIEEINRGNCAQIFGDLFQLLDRKNGVSQYPIDADTDLADYIAKELANSPRTDFPEKVKEGKKLVLPSNLYIWATMNTSDQSLFPIDSAFKRRWDWKYLKIKDHPDQHYRIKLNDEVEYDWYAFIERINQIIASMTSSADKQLGYFFCKADKKTTERANEPNSENDLISVDTFVSKVLFYLWNDVFKDYGFEDANLFKYKTLEGDKEVEKDLTFPDFYDEDGNIAPDVVKQFIENVMAWEKDKKKDNN